MDLNQAPSTSGKNPNVGDLFDDFDFKPLTSGLGFQTANKAEEAIQKAHQQVAQRSVPVRSTPVSEHPFTAHQRAVATSTPAHDYVQSDLSLFYNKATESMAAPLELPEDRTPVTATNGLRAIAFMVDFLMVSGVTWITFAMTSYLTGVDFAASLFEGHAEMIMVVVAMFTGYFLLYFTILEKFQGSSLGKEALGLRVLTREGAGPSLLRALSRSIITLVGVLSFGLTAWVDLAGKMTNTRVVRA